MFLVRAWHMFRRYFNVCKKPPHPTVKHNNYDFEFDLYLSHPIYFELRLKFDLVLYTRAYYSVISFLHYRGSVKLLYMACGRIRISKNIWY